MVKYFSISNKSYISISLCFLYVNERIIIHTKNTMQGVCKEMNWNEMKCSSKLLGTWCFSYAKHVWIQNLKYSYNGELCPLHTQAKFKWMIIIRASVTAWPPDNGYFEYCGYSTHIAHWKGFVFHSIEFWHHLEFKVRNKKKKHKNRK